MVRNAAGTWQPLQTAMEHTTGEVMDSNKAALNVAWGNVHGSYVYKGWQVERACSSGTQHRVGGNNVCGLWLLWFLWAQQAENCRMPTNSLVSGERHRGGCHCSHCMGESGLEDKGKSVVEA